MISNFHNYTTSVFFLFLLFSCERIGNIGNEFSHHLKQKLNNEVELIMDKVSPKFDANHPDTEFNKKRFLDFLKVPLSPDIKNIYCFDDAIGIDADYQFSFNCHKSTAELIRKRNNLKIDTATSDFAFGLQDEFPWWSKKKIEQLQLYSWKGEQEYYKYFWYDNKEQKAYFFDFDL